MKKIFAVIMAAMLVMALSVTAFAAEATVEGTFTCTFTDNDYDTAITGGSLTGDVEVDGTWGGSFPNITPIIEQVAPLADVTHIVVTVEADNMDACWNGTPQKLELHWNTRDNNDGAPATVDFDANGVAVVETDVPAGISAVVLNPYAFASSAGDINFKVTVVVTGNFEAPAVEEEAPAPAEEAPAAAETSAAPATGVALAVVPAVISLAAVAVTKRR